jgi:ketosteroid isomerase-like protein
MSENLEIVHRLVDGVNADAIPCELIAPDFKLTNATTAVTDATYFGYEGGLRWRRDLFDVVDDARYVVDEILAEGPDYVAVSNRLVGRGSSSGAPVELRWSSVFWFREGSRVSPATRGDAKRSQPWGCESRLGEF